MKIAIEKTAPFEISPQESDSLIFARVNIDKKSDIEQFLSLKHQNKIPILFKPCSQQPTSSWNQNFFEEVVREHVTVAKTLLDAGIHRLVIAADGDGALQQFLSPPFSSMDLKQRQKPLFEIYSQIDDFLDEVLSNVLASTVVIPKPFLSRKAQPSFVNINSPKATILA